MTGLLRVLAWPVRRLVDAWDAADQRLASYYADGGEDE